MPAIYETGNPWTDGYNMAILGKTQTGKTSTARELQDTSPRLSVWLNETGKERVDGVASEGQPVRSIEGVKKAFGRDQFAINFISKNRDRDIVRLQDWLWTVADRTDRQLPMQVIVDEVHRVAPQSNERELPPRDAVRRFAKEGVKRNIKFVGITQDPTSYDKQSLRQSEYRLVFDMSNENRTSSVVKRMGLDWDAVDRSDRYTGVLHNDAGEVLDDAVKADEGYA